MMFRHGQIRMRPISLILLGSLRGFSSTNHNPYGAATAALNVAIISGSTRTEGPPRPILSKRVVPFIEKALLRRGNSCQIVDARDVDFPLLQKPHFAYAKSQVPKPLNDIHDIFVWADAYVAITPEYNHAPSPGLLNVMNHFGSSTFGFKPSAIVSYSAGQWGGTRAAHSLRPSLSELGCLPVSAMVHIPNAQDVLDDDGTVKGGEEEKLRWDSYTARCLSQLEWWGEAAKNQKEKVDPTLASPALAKSPSQRNAP
mmetsp:Transcript_14833/g.21917  ORF Transcript_14833/g.21917 Transcript_14833/m.21917 type:complete len:256 (+) Transcript_14833:103-870(+)|eukprot:CAMPEP_0195515690 /NCGR_PEP_ID=MMETSP0794_2-20130614/6672_1 /TAXON_ID=515487 /ORGANISM="Stephanopyxis turris, Strain CCMP 815" /LENGTH=255 /DNA_ID=CAMNT_0040644153 /DNA_START=99 /DNA_END=866 /DNA_ORIENTATION=-